MCSVSLFDAFVVAAPAAADVIVDVVVVVFVAVVDDDASAIDVFSFSEPDVTFAPMLDKFDGKFCELLLLPLLLLLLPPLLLLVLHTNCNSALFIGKLSKSVIIVVCNANETSGKKNDDKNYEIH